MKRNELFKIRYKWINENHKYKMAYYKDFNYNVLSNIMYRKKSGRGSNNTYNECIIMADTETSKKPMKEIYSDYVFDDIYAYISKLKFKWNNNFKEVATKREFNNVGIHFNGPENIDVIVDEIQNRFHIFRNEIYSDIDAAYELYNYLIDNWPEDVEQINHNHVVAWTISIRAFDCNICTLYGRKPTEFVECLKMLQDSMAGEETIIYFHNLSYDWTFLRKFIMAEYGTPYQQLNVKSHYPIYIKWERGITFKDSLILAQRSLDKWSKDLNVKHQKSIGKWDYDLLRTQFETFSDDELEYIEHDTLAGVECINAMMEILNKSLFSMPYTATGIPREAVQKLAKENGGKDLFNRIHLEYLQYLIAEWVFHGGYTHANRHLVNSTIRKLVICFDFTSSYPYVLLSEKYPMEKFTPLENMDIEEIINDDENAYMFKLILLNVELKDKYCSMPPLQYSKCVKSVNAILDNGRILAADYVEIYLTEMDAKIIDRYYTWSKHICTEVNFARKDYLPRWLTDYIYSLFKDKTELKGGDPVAYALAKAKLNSVYGMMVQKNVKQNIEENYNTGEYNINFEKPEELYEKYVKKPNSVLPFQWGVWCTAYAFYNLFTLGSCCETWVYSDTDSCYGINWNQQKVDVYNENCKQKLLNNGYGAVIFNDIEYWLGVATLDGSYSEFRTQGAKRYCGRSLEDNQLHITVAGVPKKGAECLNDDIENFRPGLIFSGYKTGKKTHTYIYVDDIFIDEAGNETGDSIDLTECDYLLDSIDVVDFNKLLFEDIAIQVYEEEQKNE